MRPIRRILVALKQSRRRSSPAIQKAAALARALDAQIELFHALETPLYSDSYAMLQGIDEQRRIMTEQARGWLDALAAPLKKRGLKVSTRTAWDFPVYEAIIRRARKSRADLIVAECHEGRHAAPALLRLNDWELLRLSPVPVLLVKSAKPYSRPAILAAVDPTHAFAKPARLDEEILTIASLISAKLRGPLHVVHAFNALPAAAPAAYRDEDFTVRIEAAARKGAAKLLERTLRKRAISPSRRHLVAEHAIDGIPRIARETHSRIVVMGAISRSGLRNLFIGNTAERLIDRLSCDLLVVKPKRFKSRVSSRSRGVRIVAPAVLLP